MTNLLGNLLGGQMMHWMDVAGALCCMRHCNMHVATIAVEALEFRHPVRQGEMVCLKAKLIWAGKTSKKVKITATAENLATGATIVTNVAKYTFVALDKEGRKAAVPRLLPQSVRADYLLRVRTAAGRAAAEPAHLSTASFGPAWVDGFGDSGSQRSVPLKVDAVHAGRRVLRRPKPQPYCSNHLAESRTSSQLFRGRFIDIIANVIVQFKSTAAAIPAVFGRLTRRPYSALPASIDKPNRRRSPKGVTP